MLESEACLAEDGGKAPQVLSGDASKRTGSLLLSADDVVGAAP